MDELNQFLNSVEASARRILKQQTKKQQELIARERAALVRAAKGQGASYAPASPTKSISRDELKASYTPGGALVVAAPRSPLSPSRRSEHEADDPTVLPRLPPPSSSASPADTVAKSPSGVLSPPVLPAIDQRRSSTNNHNNNSKDAALEAARKNQRERRAADKILNSPLYKSLARPYDPPEFIPELRALFIPKANADLQEKKLQWAEFMASRQAVVEGPIASKATKGLTQAAKDALLERDPNEAQADLEKLVAKAIVYARNNNLSGLEAALDDGVDVNARDNHGNTLFILVCQQGNKKMAKFLLRRGANANLQNMNGNTALHYLVEYKHTELAEYLKSKGASDTIQNAAGLTCYEGLSVDQVEAL
ncbi:hypothetical protein ATCC90586_010304 [Pythium insidiosum]|nr:hypothetical protein ATCC90586_010304 [Pythium insidiosum]